MKKLPTRWKLACALVAAELYDMADRAVSGWYDDYLSPLDTPIMQLVNDLQQAGTPDAMLVREQVIAGEFDATPEEANTWAKSPEGRETFASLLGSQGWPPKPKTS
jgi:hypothetical protein